MKYLANACTVILMLSPAAAVVIGTVFIIHAIYSGGHKLFLLGW